MSAAILQRRPRAQFLPATLALLLLCALHLALSAASVAETPASGAGEFGNLPEGEGRDLVYYACSTCHSINLVKQQGLSRKRWDKTLNWMVEEQGMYELGPNEREIVLDYLAAHFGETR